MTLCKEGRSVWEWQCDNAWQFTGGVEGYFIECDNQKEKSLKIKQKVTLLGTILEVCAKFENTNSLLFSVLSFGYSRKIPEPQKSRDFFYVLL